MSVEDAKVFLERLRNDPALLARFQAAKSDDEGKAIIAESGLTFTLAEVAEVRDADPTEMSDEQLAAISGGSSWWNKVVHGLASAGSKTLHGLQVAEDKVAHAVVDNGEIVIGAALECGEADPIPVPIDVGI